MSVTLETRLARYAANAFRYSFLAASVFLLYACEEKQQQSKQGTSDERGGWHGRKCADTLVSIHTHTRSHTSFLSSPRHMLHTKHVRNSSLSIRANGTEHLYFLIMTLILPHLNVSPSIVATHHFLSNPPKEMNWNFLASCALFSSTITFSVYRRPC